MNSLERTTTKELTWRARVVVLLSIAFLTAFVQLIFLLLFMLMGM